MDGSIDQLLGSEGADEGFFGLSQRLEDEQKEHLAQSQGRYRDAKAPEGKLFDYSPNLGVFELPDGVQKKTRTDALARAALQWEKGTQSSGG